MDEWTNTLENWKAPKNINFVITQEQALLIANRFNKPLNNISDAELCNCLDDIIDDYCN